MRFDVDSFREIADSLVRNKSRSLLTGFGVFWGVFMLLFMLGGGQGIKDAIYANFEGFATNTAIMVSSQTSEPYKGFKEGRYWEMTYTDVERLKQMIPELETVTPTVSSWGSAIVRGSNTTQGSLKGVYQRYEKQYPGIVRAIHQENAGHGGAVNTGIREATGVFFKNIDSDDWADTGVLLTTKYLMMAMMSSLVRTRVSGSMSRFSLRLMR